VNENGREYGNRESTGEDAYLSLLKTQKSVSAAIRMLEELNAVLENDYTGHTQLTVAKDDSEHPSKMIGLRRGLVVVSVELEKNVERVLKEAILMQTKLRAPRDRQ
jgi:hypothetical protein